jgi:hypothetical protein
LVEDAENLGILLMIHILVPMSNIYITYFLICLLLYLRYLGYSHKVSQTVHTLPLFGGNFATRPNFYLSRYHHCAALYVPDFIEGIAWENVAVMKPPNPLLLSSVVFWEHDPRHSIDFESLERHCNTVMSI